MIKSEVHTLILTGIYGSGKTTLANEIMKMDSRHLVSLDNEIGYSQHEVPADTIELIDRQMYAKITNGSRVLLDGLPIYDNFHPKTDRPVNFILGTRTRFLDYLDAYPSTEIVVLVCKLNTWLNERLITKSPEIKELSEKGIWNNQHPEWAEREAHYRGFYGTTLPWLLENAASKIRLYSTDN